MTRKTVSWRDIEPLRICFSGDRNWTDKEMVHSHVVDLIVARQDKEMVFLEGGCRGLDTIVREEAEIQKIPVHTYHANWAEYGKRAGPIRNRQMLVEGMPHMVMAYHPNLENSKGTLDLVNQAEALGIPVVVFDSSGNPSCDWLNLRVSALSSEVCLPPLLGFNLLDPRLPSIAVLQEEYLAGVDIHKKYSDLIRKAKEDDHGGGNEF